jgi:hypothetical protein
MEVLSKKPVAIDLRHDPRSGSVELKKISEQFFPIQVPIHQNILEVKKMKIPGVSRFGYKNITGLHIFMKETQFMKAVKPMGKSLNKKPLFLQVFKPP